MVLQDLTPDLPQGEVTAILGPNGCGKSTLLRACARLIVPLSGKVTLGGQDVRQHDSRKLARKLAILPQAPFAPPKASPWPILWRGGVSCARRLRHRALP